MKWACRVLLGFVIALLPSCAQQNPAITTSPSHEELPTIPAPGRLTPATVLVEGTQDQPQAQLTPTFEPPALTTEEREVLGLDTPRYRFLPGNVFFSNVNRRVGSWFGGPATAAAGRGLPTVYVDKAVSVAGRAGQGGATVESDPARRTMTGVHHDATQTTGVGPRGGVRVETDPLAKKVAKPGSHDER